MNNYPFKTFPCNCASEGIVVICRDNDLDEYEGAPYIELSFWQYGFGAWKLGFWNRLRWCWKILRTGIPYTDMVSMNSKTAKNFANHIHYLLQKKKDAEPKEPEMEDGMFL